MKTLKSIPNPQFGIHYDIGWSFFSFTNEDFVSIGIRVFENPLDVLKGEEVPSHTGIVTGPNTCVEAIAQGVLETPLSPRFNDPHKVVWFRRPFQYTQEMGSQISNGALQEKGKKYNNWMIGAHLFSNTIGGRTINFITGGWLTKVLTHCADKRTADICSMVTGYGMVRSPILMEALGTNKGVLANEVHTLTPDELDNDHRIYCPRGSLAR